HPEDSRALLRPHACREPVRGVVRLLDGFVGRSEGQHREHRPEDLLLGDPVALRDVGEDRRGEPVALLGYPARRLVDPRVLPLPASSRWIALPTSVEPVKAILSTSALTSAAPVAPSPVTMLTTPGGSSAWRSTSQKSSADSGVVSAGFSTTVFPAASAGAIFQASISSGKF